MRARSLDRVDDAVHRELVPPRGVREAAAQPAPIMLHRSPAGYISYESEATFRGDML